MATNDSKVFLTENNSISDFEQAFSENLSTKRYGRHFAFLKSAASTNAYIKDKCLFLPDGFCAVACEQYSGRGRLGKSFESPVGGLYMSIYLKSGDADCDKLTVKAAVAVCRAIERITGLTGLGIKWVNDIIYREKKVCGILAERVYINSDEYYTVLGIGINVNTKFESFSNQVRDISASLFEFTGKYISMSHLSCAVLSELEKCFDEENRDRKEKITDEYRERSVIIGKNITLHKGREKISAKVLGIDDNAALYVEYKDGKNGIISAGEISVKLDKNKN